MNGRTLLCNSKNKVNSIGWSEIKMKDTYSCVKRQKLTVIAVVKNGKNSSNALNFDILHMASTYKLPAKDKWNANK